MVLSLIETWDELVHNEALVALYSDRESLETLVFATQHLTSVAAISVGWRRELMQWLSLDYSIFNHSHTMPRLRDPRRLTL